MSTRWQTQFVHSISYPAPPSPSSPTSTTTSASTESGTTANTSTTTTTSATSTYSHRSSSSTSSLPSHYSATSAAPCPSPLHSTPFPPPPPLPSPTSVPPASAPVAVSVSASTPTSTPPPLSLPPPPPPPLLSSPPSSSKLARLEPENITTNRSRLRHRASSGALSRLRSSSASSLNRLFSADIIPSFEPPPTSAPVMAERPAIYVHFEFGVSWTPRQPPKNRQITYMSRSMRERGNQFPRQLPAPNTNYLADSHFHNTSIVAQPQYEQQQFQLQDLHPQSTTAQGSRFPRDIVAIPPPQSVSPGQQQINAQIQQQWETLLPRRTSRSQSRSSHERGRSAPPPFNESPWDVNPGSSSTNVMSNNLPRDQRPAAPEVWKALPATPNQFRLGEEGMPWSSWTFPLGYTEDESGEYDEDEEGRRRSSSRHDAEVSVVSPFRPEATDRDKGKAREMQSLAAALVTVDNGFEDQWWHQGSRLAHVEGRIIPQAPTSQPRRSTQESSQEIPAVSAAAWSVSPQDTSSLAFAGSQDGQENAHHQQPSWETFSAMTPRSSIVDMVSPISEFASPVPSFQGLHRSLTTRSDELHM